jgi:hypothetical protein
MYSWMLKRKMQGTISVEIQDVETTNAKLSNGGFDNGKLLTPIEMCNILGVDGIVTSNYSLSMIREVPDTEFISNTYTNHLKSAADMPGN